MTRCVVCGSQPKRIGILMGAEGFAIFRGRVYCRSHDPAACTTPEQRAEVERKLRRLTLRTQEHDDAVRQPVHRMPHIESGTLGAFLGGQD